MEIWWKFFSGCLKERLRPSWDGGGREKQEEEEKEEEEEEEEEEAEETLPRVDSPRLIESPLNFYSRSYRDEARGQINGPFARTGYGTAGQGRCAGVGASPHLRLTIYGAFAEIVAAS
jgi:hypothetical protein